MNTQPEARPVPPFKWFEKAGFVHPSLCYLTSSAVGFPVSIYWLDEGDGEQYQVMRWRESPGPGKAFWDWHLRHMPQFFPTPEAACVAFVASWGAWSIANAGAGATS